MSRGPILIPHQVSNGDATELDALLAERLPDVEVRVANTPPASLEAIPDAVALLTWGVSEEQLEAAASLEWIQAISAGVGGYDQEALCEAGILLTNGAGLHAGPIAEQVMGYLLAFERDLPRAWRQGQRCSWEKFRPGELDGRSLGVVGLGSIGGRVAELASAFGMDVIGTKRDPTDAPDAADAVYGPDGLYDVLPESEYLLVSCPLTDETRGLLGSDEIGALPDGAVLVNVARGAIVDEDVLVRTLQQGGLRGAALDVFEEEPLPADSPLWTLSNVIVTPHNAGWGRNTLDRAADLFAENYRRFVDGDVDAMQNRVV